MALWIAGVAGCEVVAELPVENAVETRPLEPQLTTEIAPAPEPALPNPPTSESQANLLENQVIHVFESAGPGS